MLRVPLDELCLQIKLLDLGDVAGTFSQAYGSILTVILHINDVPCCWVMSQSSLAGRSSRPG